MINTTPSGKNANLVIKLYRNVQHRTGNAYHSLFSISIMCVYYQGPVNQSWQRSYSNHLVPPSACFSVCPFIYHDFDSAQ